ncbi:MAG: hypothetical protein MK089_10900 [Phycisphaerales bacterium]|nr:hypothetical protein [Phycisphaerales bacterium]
MIRTLVVVMLAVASSGILGCENSQRSSRRLSPPRPEATVMKVLRDVNPNRMTLTVAPKAEDVEGDGQADLIKVSVVMFDEPRPEPVIVPGSFRFEAVPMEGSEVENLTLQWEFDSAEASRAEGPTMFGLPGYRFTLDVRSQARDLPPMVVNIIGHFYPANGGTPVTCRPDQRLVRLGVAP